MKATFQSEAWRVDAACKDVTNPEIFFPANSGAKKKDSPTLSRVQKYCRVCPVLLTCAKRAVEEDSEGVWAGVYFSSVTKERRQTQRKVRAILVQEGAL